MAGGKLVMMAMALVIFSAATGWEGVAAQRHHVVGEDRGWDSTADLAAWSSGRVYRVGDKIWFTYLAGEDSILELGSMQEYLTCDITNPIRMFTDGIDKVALDAEGARYFISGKLENCKNGLKLHVNVQPQVEEIQKTLAADAPKSPSAATRSSGLSWVAFAGILVYILGFNGKF